MNPADLALAAAAEHIRARELSPVELVESCLERALGPGARLGAFITVDRDGALAAARHAERDIMRDGPRTPLHGVPMAVKDVIATAGLRTTAGSRLLNGWVPTRDAAIVRALRQAGAVVLGKTHTTEFAVWGTGGHPLYRVPRNPWDPCRVPGGSSTGSGIAVAAGCVPAAVGTDTGGSIRIPAALCGVAALKPTRSRVSTRGVIPLSPSCDHVGVMARSVEDLGVVLRALGVRRRGYAPSGCDLKVGAQVVDPRAMVGLAEGVSIGVLELPSLPQPAVVQALAGAIEVLGRLGMRLTDVAIPSAAHAEEISHAVQHFELWTIHRQGIAERPHEYGSEVTEGCRLGQAISAADYTRARGRWPALIDEVDAALEGVDAILAPTVGFTAPLIGEEDIVLGGRRQTVNTVISAYTRLYNMTGHPALSLPCGFDADGLPIGMQLIGRRGSEETILNIGTSYERATGWSSGRHSPPVVLRHHGVA